MGTYTPKRGLYKPDIGERGWGDKVNNNFDILDDHKHDASDIVSGRFSFDRLPTAEAENVVLVLRESGSDPIYDKIRSVDIISGAIQDYHLADQCITTPKFHPSAIAPDSDKLDGYHASLTPQPNTIPIADEVGKIKREWLQHIDKVWFILNPINTNTRYIPYVSSARSLTTLRLVPETAYYIPFIPRIDCTIVELAINITVAGGIRSRAQIGVYSSDSYRPYNLLGYITVSTDTKGVKYGTVNIKLNSYDLYWLAIACSDFITIHSVSSSTVYPILGIIPGTVDYITYYYEQISGHYLPSKANASYLGTGNVPAIFIKISSP